MSSAATSALAAPAMAPAALRPLSFVLLGGTGRTGLPFLEQSLARGHRVTAFMRSMNKLPAALRSHPGLTAVQAELHETDKIQQAIIAAKPDAVYSMLASDPAPHTAISTGTRAALGALQNMHAAHQAEQDATAAEAASPSTPLKPTPFFIILAWGLGPTKPMANRWYERFFLSAASLFFPAGMLDFNKTIADLDEVASQGVIRPTRFMPPRLTTGPLTSTYEAVDIHSYKGSMLSSISRASLAQIALRLGEQAANDEPVPEWVAVRDP